MTKRASCPPPPTGGRSASLHFYTLRSDETLYRVYRGADAAQFRIGAARNRFNPLPVPWNATKVLYAGSSREAAISETVLRWHDRVDPAAKIILARSQIEGRQLVGLRWDQPLQLLDFTGFGMQPLAELVEDGQAEGIFLSDASHYILTQQWGAWFRSAYPNAAGLRWMSRQHNSSYCCIFFDDVCRGRKLTEVETAEHFESGSTAHSLLQLCLDKLSWEIEP
jgi:hypothetical protein